MKGCKYLVSLDYTMCWFSVTCAFLTLYTACDHKALTSFCTYYYPISIYSIGHNVYCCVCNSLVSIRGYYTHMHTCPLCVSTIYIQKDPHIQYRCVCVCLCLLRLWFRTLYNVDIVKCIFYWGNTLLLVV